MPDIELQFSVVIPTCDRPATLPACLKTVLSQSYRNLQIVVQDNSSDNRTKAVVELIWRQQDFISPLGHTLEYAGEF